jgi:homoserine O-acetyltransferase
MIAAPFGGNKMIRTLALAASLSFAVAAAQAQQTDPAPLSYKTQEGDFIAHDFHFGSGETMPELRLHYTTVGQPQRDAKGHVTNAVLVLHGTGGDGHQFERPFFGNVLFGAGGLLDASRYFIVMPDSIGHGKSSKPSDGMHAHFPQYDYDDMVKAQYRLLTEGLKVDHLRLIMGTSMGCMHGFVWGETYPDFMDALQPMACLPVALVGRNWLWRSMVMEAIKNDPDWQGGEYKQQPRAALQVAEDMLLIAGSAPHQMQKALPTAEKVVARLDSAQKNAQQTLDANDFLYQINASRNYNPSPKLGLIKAPMMWINSADDFINPPELGIAEQEVKKITKGHFVLLPISDKTFGHGTHTHADTWHDYLAQLLKESAH